MNSSNKRSLPSTSSSQSSSKKRRTATNSTEIKGPLTRESFLKEIAKEKLFVKGDPFYDNAKTNVGELRLKWN